MTAKVSDIALLCSSRKPAVVFVDGAYLLTPEGRLSKNEKIGEVCRELKQLAMRCNVPVVTSWQFNRESTKAHHVGIEHIAYADEIGQLSSVVLGLFEENSISTAHRRKVDVLKGRTGEMGEFYTHWCFRTMNFSEVEPDYSFELN